MVTLNLADVGKSFFNWNIIRFPDGEIQIEILDNLVNFKDAVEVKTRITCADDLFVLLQVFDILERHNISYIVDIKYLMSQRCDRLFSLSRPVSRNIVMNLICNGSRVVKIFEPHNQDVDIRWNSVYENKWYHKQLNLFMSANHVDERKLLMFYPDEHAYNRYHNPVFDQEMAAYGVKKREVGTGEIVSYHVKFEDDRYSTYDIDTIVVRDDLCDGGRTFVHAHEELKKMYPNAMIVLAVAHAVQEEGLRRVCGIYDHVFTTNSYKEWSDLDIPHLYVEDIFSV